MFRALYAYFVHVNLGYLNFRGGEPQSALVDEFPTHHAVRNRRVRVGFSHIPFIFFVSQRFDQPLCRLSPAGKGRYDDTGTTGAEIALESAPDISTVARRNERSRQRLAYGISSAL